MSYSSRTLLWLVVFFPIGLAHMLNWRCRWRGFVKAAICALPVLVVLGMMLYPDPISVQMGSVTYYGDDPTAAVYGPDVPMNYVLPFETAVPGSVVVPAEQLEDTRFFVYANEKGTCYHLDHCDYTSDSAKKLTVYEAYHRGYLPCDYCGSPPYTGGME